MLKIYGIPKSRAFRTLWMAKELGLEYENVAVSLSGANPESKQPWYLAINPNAKVPAIELDGFVLWESMAINIYLAKKFGSPLVPATLEGEAEMLKWSFWVVNNVEPHVVTMFLNRIALPAEKRSEAAVEAAHAALQAPLAVLDSALAKRPFLLGDAFTLADFNVACVLLTTIVLKYDLSRYPGVAAWIGRCSARPAAQAAISLRMA